VLPRLRESGTWHRQKTRRWAGRGEYTRRRRKSRADALPCVELKGRRRMIVWAKLVIWQRRESWHDRRDIADVTSKIFIVSIKKPIYSIRLISSKALVLLRTNRESAALINGEMCQCANLRD